MVGLRGQQIRAITSSEHFSLAVTETGELYSWGYADFGRLGHGNMPLPLDGEQWRSGEVAALPYLLAPDGISPWIPTPTQVMALAGEHVVVISCGLEHALAATRTGQLYSWGGAIYGRLGHTESIIHELPIDEEGGSYLPTARVVDALLEKKVTAVACGEVHSLAIAEGVVYCWGCASYGRLGLESPQLAELPRDEDEEQYAPTPLPILTLPPIVAIGSGILHSLAVSEDGKLYSWGCASFGCLGLGRDSIAQMHKYEDDESGPYQPTPMLLQSLEQEFVVAVECDEVHSLALTKQGQVFAWGCASYGRLGLGDSETQLETQPTELGANFEPAPQLISQLSNIKAVVCGRAHSLALNEAGEVYAWGSGDHGRLGLDCTDSTQSNDSVLVSTPALVSCLDGGVVTAVGCGYRQSFAVQCVSSKLESHLHALVDNPEFADIVFTFKSGTKIHAHKCLLAARAEYFTRCFQSNMKEGAAAESGGLMELPMEGDENDVRRMLVWLYTGEVVLDANSAEEDTSQALSLLALADQFVMCELKHQLTPLLQAQLSVENVLMILQAADHFNAAQCRRAAIEFIHVHFQQVKKASQCFVDLSRSPDCAHLLSEIFKPLESPMQAKTGHDYHVNNIV